MLKIDKWLNTIVEKLKTNLRESLLFIGLQGSYGRNEATAESDIDLVVILNDLDFKDLKIYRSIINSMPDKEKACGFVSGKSEIQKWSKYDLFQFFFDTKPLYGRLEDIIKPPEKEDAVQAVKTGSESLYHLAVHSFIHSNNYAKDLQNLYKMTFFILQAKYFIKTNNYISTKKELLKYLDNHTDKEILDTCINKDKILNIPLCQIEDLYNKLIHWLQKSI